MTNETRPTTPATDEEIADTEGRAKRVTGIGSARVLKLLARIAADAEKLRAKAEEIERWKGMWDETAGCADGHEPIRWEPGRGSKDCPYCALRVQVETLREAMGDDAAGRTAPELLRIAAAVLFNGGGGPIEDCLRVMASRVEAAIAATEPKGEGK